MRGLRHNEESSSSARCCPGATAAPRLRLQRHPKRVMHKTKAASGSSLGNALPRIKVIGVGGCASHAVQQLWDSTRDSSMEPLIMNTDVQELAYNTLPDQNKLLLGIKAANWMSTRGDASIGKAAAMECADAIGDMVQDADLVVVVAGMGGGTGRGAAPAVAAIAKQHGAFTVAVAATPTSLSARQNGSQAVHELYQAADAMVVIPTHKLLAGSSRPLNSTEVYQVSDQLLLAGIRGMAGWVQSSGLSDMRSLRDSMAGGSSWIGHGTAMGPERAMCAAVSAINNPLRLSSISQACSLLLIINAPQDFSVAELADITGLAAEECGPDVHMAYRILTAPAPSGPLSVTVIATHAGPSSMPAEPAAMPVGFRQQ